MLPRGKQVALSPTFFVTFDQRVDPQALLPHIVLGKNKHAKTSVVGLELVTDAALTDFMPGAKVADWKGRWIAF